MLGFVDYNAYARFDDKVVDLKNKPPRTHTLKHVLTLEDNTHLGICSLGGCTWLQWFSVPGYLLLIGSAWSLPHLCLALRPFPGLSFHESDSPNVPLSEADTNSHYFQIRNISTRSQNVSWCPKSDGCSFGKESGRMEMIKYIPRLLKYTCPWIATKMLPWQLLHLSKPHILHP